MKRPSDFTHKKPWNSVTQSNECETVAQKIMLLMEETGNVFRPITWEEYQQNFPMDSKCFFDEVIKYCKSAETAACFSKVWE